MFFEQILLIAIAFSRSDKGGDLAFVAIAGQGGALSNTKEALGFSILKYALGAGPYIHFGSGGGILGRTVGNLNEPHAISAINMNYSDTGLFGVLIACTSNVAGKLIDNALSVLKSGKVSDEDFNRGGFVYFYRSHYIMFSLQVKIC